MAHQVESVAAERGWANGSHRDIGDNARRLIPLTPSPTESRRIFMAMNALHVNFYEENLHPEDIDQAIDDARTLIDSMKIAESRLPEPREPGAASR